MTRDDTGPDGRAPHADGWAARTRRALLSRAPVRRVAERVCGTLHEGTLVWERDWDVLCVLDACRVDALRAAATDRAYLPDPGTAAFGTIWSVGSQSAEWMDRTFAPTHRAEMADTAYVTGNPFTDKSPEWMDPVAGRALPLDAADFALLYEAWRDQWIHADISTIPPRPLTDAAIDVWRRREAFGADRLIVHYMQPHAPFRSRPEWFYGDADLEGWGAISGEDGVGEGLWAKLRDGTHSAEAFWAAYRDNLEWVLDDVALLVENCDADVVLTADHGNGHGEWGVWSHPPGVSLPPLRRVPWVEVEGRDRRTRDPGPVEIPEGREIDATVEVEQRLADLGYT
ncbi:MAG: hypothetical protein ABEJ23_05440 [Haloarculaceae archaeon]